MVLYEYYFFIGNGFDINLGLHTGYTYFYPYFIKEAHEDNLIRNWINENVELWSDLEERLGQELNRIQDSDDLNKFYNDKDELDRLLIDYLEMEQKSIVLMIRNNLLKNLAGACKSFIRNCLQRILIL